jgi:hypothetical protein
MILLAICLKKSASDIVKVLERVNLEWSKALKQPYFFVSKVLTLKRDDRLLVM